MPMIDDIRLKQPLPTFKLLYAHILLDRSGSMGPVRTTTIGAVNEYMNGLSIDGQVDSHISLSLFDTDPVTNDMALDCIRDNAPAMFCAKLALEEYVPRGSTPLNDAIGKTVAMIESQKRRAGENVAFVILTDGLENASCEYDKAAIKALLERVQKEMNWLVLFLGANQDAFQEGVVGRGTMVANTMSYDTANMSASMQAASRSSRSFAVSGQNAGADVGFTDEERKEAVKK
jgi:uncharacterized protein YegL